MRYRIFLVFFILLLAQISWFICFIIPKSSFHIPTPVRMILNGNTPLREVYKNKELFKNVYNALGDETPIGIQFEILHRRYYPKPKDRLIKDNSLAPAYYTLNDWALGMLEFIPFNDLPKVDAAWRNEVSTFMYQGSLKPIYGLENSSFDNNKVLVLKWKSLLQKYLF